jgi:hypothetical protein
VLAAKGVAKSILREEIGAACLNAHARTKFCQRATARRTGGAGARIDPTEIGRMGVVPGVLADLPVGGLAGDSAQKRHIGFGLFDFGTAGHMAAPPSASGFLSGGLVGQQPAKRHTLCRSGA